MTFFIVFYQRNKLKLKIYKLFKILFNPRLFLLFLKYNVIPSFEHILLIKKISESSTIIDIGSNKGQFSLLAQKYNPSSKIISFEPLKKPSDIYLKIFKSNKNVKHFNFAIGPIEKNIEMNVSRKIDSSSVLPITSKQASIFKGTELLRKEQVSIKPLDKLISNKEFNGKTFVKIDVQGFELEVIKGCKKYINFFNYIYVECSFIELYEKQSFADEVVSYLEKNDFKLIGVFNTSYDLDGNSVQSDFLFKKGPK